MRGSDPSRNQTSKLQELTIDADVMDLRPLNNESMESLEKLD
jgi:hypothetical protein